jgi:glutathione S-transferase
MLTLYYSPGLCSMAPHIVLHEFGQPFEARPISLRKGEHKAADYLRINPKGKVPVLIADGQPLTEIAAILPYLAKRFPASGLWPFDSLASEAHACSVHAWLASGVQPNFARLFRPNGYCDGPGSEESVRRLAVASNAANFALIEAMLAGKGWALDLYSTVDAHLFVYFRWAIVMKLDVAPFPRYAAHYERMLERAAVRKMLEVEAQAQARLDGTA